MLLAMKKMVGGVMVAVAMLAMTAEARAQAPSRFLVGAGFGYGSADAGCEGCEGDRQSGAAGYFRIGYAVTPKIVVGLETNVWAKEEAFEDFASATLLLSSVTGTVSFYPKETGFFVRGGVGGALANLDLDVEGSGVNADLGRGLSVVGGVGYDLRISRRLSITPGVNLWYGKVGDLKALGQTIATDWSHNVVDFTIGLTFR